MSNLDIGYLSLISAIVVIVLFAIISYHSKNNKTQIQKHVNGDAKYTMEWSDLCDVNLQAVKLQQNKSGDIQIAEHGHSNKKGVQETKQKYPYLPSMFQANAGHSLGYIAGAGTTIDLDDGTFQIGNFALKAYVEYLVAVIHSAYAYYKNWSEENTLCLKKQYNSKVTLFDTKLQQLKKIADNISEKINNLQNQETLLNNKVFRIERKYHLCSKVVVCIGPTGYGKSVVCNRLIGDKCSFAQLEESKDTEFHVARFASFNSNTNETSKKTKVVKKSKNDNKSFLLSVVYTPGAYDSSGADKKYLNEMAEYFRASGGANMFCLFFKFGGRGDKTYKQLLQLYATFWGENFWKHCVIIITNCDRDENGSNDSLDNYLPKLKNEIKQFLADEMNVTNVVPMYEFGKNNFAKSTYEIFSTLIDSKSKYNVKYKCDKIKSPIDTTLQEIKKMIPEHRLLIAELDKVSQELQELRNRI